MQDSKPPPLPPPSAQPPGSGPSPPPSSRHSSFQEVPLSTRRDGVDQTLLIQDHAFAAPTPGNELLYSDDTLCPGMKVQQKGGVTIAIDGMVTTQPQEEIFDVRKVDSNRESIARVLASEGAEDSCGIFVESVLQFP